MSKVTDNEQDEMRSAISAIADIPFAIEESVEEEVAVELESMEEDVVDAGAVVCGGADIADAVVEDDSEEKKSVSEGTSQLSLREILFGDFLLGTFLRRQVWFILFLVLLAIVYISNRYAAQQEIIEEEQLRKDLVEKKNYAQTQYAELTMMSRQSGLEDRLRAFGDSLLATSNEPPFVIRTEN